MLDVTSITFTLIKQDALLFERQCLLFVNKGINFNTSILQRIIRPWTASFSAGVPC